MYGPYVYVLCVRYHHHTPSPFRFFAPKASSQTTNDDNISVKTRHILGGPKVRNNSIVSGGCQGSLRPELIEQRFMIAFVLIPESFHTLLYIYIYIYIYILACARCTCQYSIFGIRFWAIARRLDQNAELNRLSIS